MPKATSKIRAAQKAERAKKLTVLNNLEHEVGALQDQAEDILSALDSISEEISDLREELE